jgi:hypothetical protein
MIKQTKGVKLENRRRKKFLTNLKSKIYLVLKFLISSSIFYQLIYLVVNSRNKSLPRIYKVNQNEKVNACFFVLSRNKDLNDLIKTIQQIENAFNHNYNYPYVIVGDTEFTNYFKKQIKIQTNSLVQFGLIPKGKFEI